MQKVILTKGLPASGKSTWAKAEVERTHKQFVRVNKDDLRAMMGGFDKVNEQVVLTTRDALIREALTQGKSVIVDDTNFAVKHFEAIVKIADEFGARTEIKEFHTPVNICIERDRDRANPVGAKVIREMSEQYNWGKEIPQFNPVTQDHTLPKAIIVDIDGTLAHMTGRSPYDYSRVHEDSVDDSILAIIHLLSNSYRVLFVSGRDAECYEATEKWIQSHYSGEYQLLMRVTWDKRCDTIIKREILDELIKQYYIEFSLDDRDRVVKMWRESGIKCLQVAEGNF